jgi:hypothetical protein
VSNAALTFWSQPKGPEVGNTESADRSEEFTWRSQPKMPQCDNRRLSASEGKAALVSGNGDWGFVRAAFAVSRLPEGSDFIHALCEWLHQIGVRENVMFSAAYSPL